MIENLTRAEHEVLLRQDFAAFAGRCFPDLNPQTRLAPHRHAVQEFITTRHGSAGFQPPKNDDGRFAEFGSSASRNQLLARREAGGGQCRLIGSATTRWATANRPATPVSQKAGPAIPAAGRPAPRT